MVLWPSTVHKGQQTLRTSVLHKQPYTSVYTPVWIVGSTAFEMCMFGFVGNIFSEKQYVVINTSVSVSVVTYWRTSYF